MLTHKIKTYIHSCPLCDKKFSNLVTLQSHKKSHMSKSNQSKLVCNICEQSYPRLGFSNHMKRHKAGGFICNICNTVLSNQSNLKSHIARKHSTKEKENCSFGDCEALFFAEYRLEHNKRKHSPQNDALTFACPTCGKNYITKVSLDYHVLSHTGQRPFKCQKCEYDSRDRATLKRHQLIHTKEKKFKCKICEKFFGFKHSLEDHLTTHSVERPFKCDLCDQTSKTRANLLRHIKKLHNTKIIYLKAE